MSDEPAPFRVAVDRVLAAVALVTASAPSSAAAARAKVMRTSLPFLGIFLFLLLGVRGQRTTATAEGGIRRRCGLETKW
jgi:hypothetical protein